MALQLCVLLLMAMLVGSDGAWCICRSDVSDPNLQRTLDYACGAGADCSKVQQSGPCYNPNTVRAHCSYAANSYYQRNGQVQTACDFSGTCILSNTDPSYSGCSYPATTSAAGTSTTTTGMGGTTSTPGVFSPPGTVMGGLGPSGSSMSDNSGAGDLFEARVMATQLLAAFAFSLMLLYLSA